MNTGCFRDLGRMFHDCYKADEVEFVYGTGGKALRKEVERVSELIEYVKKKKAVLEGKPV